MLIDGAEFFGNAADGSSAIDAGERSVGSCEEFVAAEELVFVFELRGGDATDPRSQFQQVVVAGRLAEAAFGFDDDHVQLLLFHEAVISAGGPQQLGASHLEVGEVIRVMEVPHRVGFAVSDADFNFVFAEHSGSGRGCGAG